MRTLTRIGVSAVAAGAALTLTAGSATAATTTVRRDTATGAAYSGNWRITNIGNLTFTATVLGINITASCPQVTLTGTVQSAGTGTLNQATVGACSSSAGSAQVAFEGLPYTQGQVTYAPVAGGRDGTLSISDPGLRIKVVMNILGTQTCYYGFGSTVGSLTFNVYNRDNPNRPVPSVDDAQGSLNNARLDRLTGSSSLCPTTGTGNGNATARGETTAGSGVFDQKLYITG
ncbi:hypothetical protein GCM10023085_54400 [Actinomadura viridis]|uniref:Tat pathway signal sequence domain protein n=1 Tax=Actinomadura viridis TaxID=58110 RepID=A0A931D8J5_9ACTN|nr:hypothetical protein [Actinomadura viridis]MBG6086399.1 hypothetical protein [Actinomadura viridis]